ncbi:hypothetical protein [Pedobacter psychroterrae]|uniref:SnoaL-like protein n=1 Tax=Pedobacter psychroterrae TaxID=2530453 RepID=A0A4R0NKI1_9SPHI|nr:hypothetical protein [Pedobacter psychroterrae]TCD01280.1 hypothetical protein EZ437_11045 [Pedobacter psychroterrae]
MKKTQTLLGAVLILGSLTIPTAHLNAQTQIQTKNAAVTPVSVMDKAVYKHFEVLNISSSERRLSEMGKIYSSDFHIVDTFFEHFTCKDFNNAVNEIHKKFPGQNFTLVEVKTLNNVARATWKLGDALNGENIFLFKDGKITDIIAFVSVNK